MVQLEIHIKTHFQWSPVEWTEDNEQYGFVNGTSDSCIDFVIYAQLHGSSMAI